MKIVCIIPARLASSRLPNKVVKPIFGLPMVEHVRRRALLSGFFDKVLVATCDQQIAELVDSHGGQYILTSDSHLTGTSRASEAIQNIDSTHTVVIQADEPLVLPEQIECIVNHIKSNPAHKFINLVSPLESEQDLKDINIVKCSVGLNHRILYCFRKSPSVVPFQTQIHFIRKMQGMIAFASGYLADYSSLSSNQIDHFESIEQLRILESGNHLFCSETKHSVPSVNTQEDFDEVLSTLAINNYQKSYLQEILDI